MVRNQHTNEMLLFVSAVTSPQTTKKNWNLFFFRKPGHTKFAPVTCSGYDYILFPTFSKFVFSGSSASLSGSDNGKRANFIPWPPIVYTMGDRYALTIYNLRKKKKLSVYFFLFYDSYLK